MTRSRIQTWLVCCLATFALASCTSDTTSTDSTGALNLNLELAPGIEIDEVDWTITSPGMDDMMGTIDTSAPGSTASVEVFGLPPGDDYNVELEAMSEDGETSCRGDADFGVDVDETTVVMVFLNCKRPERLGGVRVNGKFNICAELEKVIVSPLQTSIGNDIDLSAETVDIEDDDVTILWTATGGSIDNPSAEMTTYTCGEVGDHEITVRVSDDGFEECTHAWTVAVTCVPGDGLECVEDSDCDAGEICVDNECVPDLECVEDADCGAGEICVDNECVPDLECVEDADCGAGEICVDNECVPDLECVEDADCGAGEICVENECVPDVECVVDGDCPGGGECTAPACVEGTCEISNLPNGTACADDTGTCSDGICIDNCLDVVCEDIECNVTGCNPFTGECEALPVEDGTACDGGVCMAGVCEPTQICEYEQDFEGLGLPGDDPAALGDDGWVIFANVFEPDGTTYIRGYGGGPAPNGGDGYSAVVEGEGGLDQGDQQLSIYGDYINQPDQQAGNVIEALVFQERSIVASDVGNTYTFTFDFKRGNIEGASTALAFIKTLDPNAGFQTTNFITEDTTNAGATWDTRTIQITIDAGLVGQLLQYGFQNKSSNNEGSGIFYDNVSFCTDATAPECVVDADCEDNETCEAGVCVPTGPLACEYDQDFEGLGLPGDDPAALGDDGWRIFANVFEPDGTTYIRGYGGGPAPNGGDGYSAVVEGEGGPDQGDQQLSIYGDYINQPDQQAGNVIEALVFQERSIEASEVGNTYTFTFDFKRGNIEGASTALAFIKTLDPNAGFQTTNFITEDTTNAGATWDTRTIQITIDAGLVGQLLQYGFQNKSSNNEGSGIFYDNASFGPDGCGGNGGGGPEGNIAINGGFETGAFNDGSPDASWQQFVLGGTQAIITDNPSEGIYAANLNIPVRGAGDPGVDTLIKNANLEAGNLTPGQAITVTWDMRGSLSGAGGVVFVELFSELSGGGTSKTEIYTGGPIFPTEDWESFSWNTTLGPDVSGGVTLQLKAGCGGVEGCGADVYFDNVTITLP